MPKTTKTKTKTEYAFKRTPAFDQALNLFLEGQPEEQVEVSEHPCYGEVGVRETIVLEPVKPVIPGEQLVFVHRTRVGMQGYQLVQSKKLLGALHKRADSNEWEVRETDESRRERMERSNFQAMAEAGITDEGGRGWSILNWFIIAPLLMFAGAALYHFFA